MTVLCVSATITTTIQSVSLDRHHGIMEGTTLIKK